MNLAVRTAAYGDRPLEEVARTIAEAGYEAVCLDLDVWRLGVTEGGLTAPLAERLAGAFARESVAVAAVAVEVDLVGGGAAAVDQLLAVIEVAESFETAVVVTTSGPGDDWTAVLDGLNEVLDAAEDHGVVLVLEPRAGMAVDDLDDLELLLDAVESDNFGIALDLLAVSEANDISVEELLARVGDALIQVTICDLDDGGSPVPASPRSATDFAGVFELLAACAPEVTVVAGGVDAADAAATRLYLARFL